MAGLGKKQGVCIDIPQRRVEAFSEVVSEQVVERIGPVYKLLLLFVKNPMQPSLWFMKTQEKRTVVVACRGMDLQKSPVFDTSFFEILLLFVLVFGDKLDFHRFRLFAVCCFFSSSFLDFSCFV